MIGEQTLQRAAAPAEQPDRDLDLMRGDRHSSTAIGR